MKNIQKKCLRVTEKAVLLHPLSERTSEERMSGRGSVKFFESLRPAQASEGMPKNRNLVRNTADVVETSGGGTRDSE